MKVIGVTGPSGAGKSDFIKLLGITSVSADKIARKVVVPGSKCLDMLCKHFGKNFVKENGELDREELAKTAFSSVENTAFLNKATHPFIVQKIEQELERYRQSGEVIAVLDAPQLFEAGCEKFCDIIVGVVADREVRIRRIVERDKISRERAETRLKIEKNRDFFEKNCDFLIENNGDFVEFCRKTEEIIEALKALEF